MIKATIEDLETGEKREYTCETFMFSAIEKSKGDAGIIGSSTAQLILRAYASMGYAVHVAVSQETKRED